MSGEMFTGKLDVREKAIAEIVIGDSIEDFKRRDPNFNDEEFVKDMLSDETKLRRVASKIPAFYLGDFISAEQLGVEAPYDFTIAQFGSSTIGNTGELYDALKLELTGYLSLSKSDREKFVQMTRK